MKRRGSFQGRPTGGAPSSSPGSAASPGGAKRHRRGDLIAPDNGTAGPPPSPGARGHRHVGPSIPPPEPTSGGGGQVAFGFEASEAPAERVEPVPEGQGRILLGTHAVAEALRAGRRAVQVVYLSAEERGERFRDIAHLARSRSVAVRQSDPELLDTLAAGRVHQGIAALAGEYPYLTLGDLERVVQERCGDVLLVCLDQVQDPQNLGAILRSCVAFGADVVVMPERRAAAVTESTVRASAGATELVRIARVPNLAEALRRCSAAGVEIVGIDPEGEVDLGGAGLRPPVAVVLGGEGPGLRRLTRELCHRRVRIPIAAGGVASLNVSVSAGIVLHAVRSGPVPPAD